MNRMTHEEILAEKPVCADFPSFRAGVRAAERIYKPTRRVRAGQPPCSFGTGCSASKDCADHDCQNHPVNTDMLGLPVIDTKFLDEQIQPKELPIEMIEPERQPWKGAALFVAAVLAGLCIFFFSNK